MNKLHAALAAMALAVLAALGIMFWPQPPPPATNAPPLWYVTDGLKEIYSNATPDGYNGTWWLESSDLGGFSMIFSPANPNAAAEDINLTVFIRESIPEVDRLDVQVFELKLVTTERQRWNASVTCANGPFNASLGANDSECADNGSWEFYNESRTAWKKTGQQMLKNKTANNGRGSLGIINLEKAGSKPKYDDTGLVYAENGRKWFKVVVTWPVTAWSKEGHGGGWGGIADVGMEVNGHEITPFGLANYIVRENLNATNSNASTALNVNYTLAYVMDTATPISTGLMQADCDDLRVTSNQSGTEYEVDRRVTGCNTATTLIEFRTNQTIAASTTKRDYFIYYGNPSATAPTVNYSNVDAVWEDGVAEEAFVWTKNGTACGMTGTEVSCNSAGATVTASLRTTQNFSGFKVTFQARIRSSAGAGSDNILFYLYNSSNIDASGTNWTYLDVLNSTSIKDTYYTNNNFFQEGYGASETWNAYNVTFNMSNMTGQYMKNGVVRYNNAAPKLVNNPLPIMIGWHGGLKFRFELDNVSYQHYVHPVSVVSNGVEYGCGTVSANITLTNNVTTTGTCFTLGASNVRINGNGYSITGDGGATDYAVVDSGYSNVWVENFSRIESFSDGARIANTENVTIKNNTFFNLTGASVDLVTTASNSTVVANNTFENVSQAFNAGALLHRNLTISSNAINNVAADAILVNCTGNATLASNTVGVNVSGAILTLGHGCTASSITGNTFWANGSSAIRLRGANTVFANNTIHLYASGATGAAIAIGGANNSLVWDNAINSLNSTLYAITLDSTDTTTNATIRNNTWNGTHANWLNQTGAAGSWALLQHYARAYVENQSAQAEPSATVLVKNNLSATAWTGTTGASGYTAWFPLNDTNFSASRTYYNTHQSNASSASPQNSSNVTTNVSSTAYTINITVAPPFALNITTTLPTGITAANFTCFQAYMNNTPPNGQTKGVPILNVTNINTTGTFVNITLALNQSLPTGFSIWAQVGYFRHPGSVNLTTSGQTVIRRLTAGNSTGIWMWGDCYNVSNNLATSFNFSFGGGQ